MFLSLKTLYRKRTVIWPFYFYTIIRTLSLIFKNTLNNAPELKANFNFIKKIDGNSITIINKDEEVDLTNLLNLVGKNPLIKIESNDNLLSSYFYKE